MPIHERTFAVYIATNRHRTVLYTGVTNDLARRMAEHRDHVVKGFTNRYNVEYLAYYECTDNPEAAIMREKQIKGWVRAKKVALIEKMNSSWRDLAEDL